MARTVKLDTRKERQVEELFRLHFVSMCKLANSYITDFDNSKDIVHEVFTSFWQKFDTLPEDTQFKSYLFTATKNKSLNYLRDNKKHQNVVEVEPHMSTDTQDTLESKELASEIEYGINLLPDRCREVFKLSRFEGLKYNQIAEELEISVKTVEGQMSKALRLLKDHLKEFLTAILFFINMG